MGLSDKRVLITGATGLIGKDLILPLYQNGFEVYAITRNNTSVNKYVRWVRGDLFNVDFVKSAMEQIRPEYLLNMAWCTTGNYLSSDLNYKFLDAGCNLLQQFKNVGGKRAIFTGTCFEYKFKDTPLKESDELDADKTTYTFCKNKLRKL